MDSNKALRQGATLAPYHTSSSSSIMMMRMMMLITFLTGLAVDLLQLKSFNGFKI